ncbi:protein of unknown function (DUF4476) [Desmophyllum pertusum]|uniref:DUF4476 domain-containing protein n=1 Tax=Desmophyllum pertusum TaxID=174260 RepID=A0A9W9YZ04_9CNID|nr:protein of unknown function (DUF4476) [Desmophyllum pertusum]
MDSSSFENIKSAVEEQSFKDEKIDALKATLSCAHGYLSADQVAQLVQEFSFDDDKVKAVEICAPRMYSTTCEQAAAILRVFSFDKSKTSALEVIACHITDDNLSALDSVFSFVSDRNRAKEILMNRDRGAAGPQPGLPPQPGVYPGVGPPAGGFPGMVPHAGGYPGMVPHAGGYPAPSPYPGTSPYPGQGPYVPGPYGGICPPGQAPYAQPGPGAVPPQYPTGGGVPGGALGAMEGIMNATAGAADSMFGPPRYPPPGGYPHQGYPYQPPK